MLNTQTRRIGVVGFTLVLAAILAMLLFALVGGTGSGLKDSLGYKGIVEYKVFGPDGILKDSGIFHNAINTNPGLDDTVNRLISATDVDLYNKILAAGVARLSATAAYTNVAGLANLGATVDTAPAVVVGNNPAAGTVTASSAGGGSGTVVVTFQAEASSAVVELALVSDAAAAAAADISAIVDGDILATQGVTITLAAKDTLVVTWTVTATAP